MKIDRFPRFDPARPPVLLLGGLNLVRALGFAGIPAIVAASHAYEPAFASRHCAARLALPPSRDPRAVLEVLAAAGERLAGALGRRVPLFYGNDEWQRLVQTYRAELARHYTLLLNDPDVADAVIDKDRFQAFAAARGLPIPRALAWEALEDYEGPVLAKPRSKIGWHASPVHLRLFGKRGKARIFASGRALLAEPLALQLRDEILIQEYVSGDDRHIGSFHGFSDEAGRLLDWFTGRKIRTYPALTGESTFLELTRDEALEALGRRIAEALPLKGVFKIDVKRDARTGRLYLLEVNARFNLWHYMGAANGVNLPRTAYDYLLYRARPSAPGRYRTTHRWIYLRGDWSAYRELAARGELRFAGWLASITAQPAVYNVLSWADPFPLLWHGYHWTLARLPRLPGMLRRWLFTAS